MRAYIFDLDGTLLNTLADIGNACNFILRKYGFPEHPLASYSRMVGNGFRTLLIRALPAEAGLSVQKLDEIVSEARAWYGSHMMEQTIPYAGMDDTLAALASRGDFLGVLSNKPDHLSIALIRNYFPTIQFQHIQGAREGVALKPNPSALLAILKTYGLDCAESCYVGDSDVDIETAHNAAVKALGAGWGFRGATELASAGADAVLHEPSQLLEFCEAASH